MNNTKNTRQTKIQKKEVVDSESTIELWSLRRTTDLGFSSRPFVACSLPLRPLKDPRTGKFASNYERKNGDHFLKLLADENHGVPYGKDRLLIYWLLSEAVKTKDRDVQFQSYNEVLGVIGLTDSGINHKWLKQAINRIMNTAMIFSKHEPGVSLNVKATTILEAVIADERSSRFRLSTVIFDELTKHSIPMDLEVIRQLAKEECYGAMDLYAWWSWRSSRLQKERHGVVSIPLEELQFQFGCSSSAPLKEFKRSLARWVDLLNEIITKVYRTSTGLEVHKTNKLIVHRFESNWSDQNTQLPESTTSKTKFQINAALEREYEEFKKGNATLSESLHRYMTEKRAYEKNL